MQQDANRIGRQRHCGFTLVELVVALSIIAILAGIGMSMFRSQMMRAKRTEAVVGLHTIDTSERAFFASNQSYGDTFEEIGYVLEGGSRVDERTIQAKTYTFGIEARLLDGNPRGNFQAVATGDLDPGDGVLDVLIIENVLTVLP